VDPNVFLYLTTTGRTSGSARRIEIWFVEESGAFYIVSERRHDVGWVKNLEREPRITFSIGTRDRRTSVVPDTPARARIVDGSREPEIVRRVSALMDDKYGWSDGLIVELAREGVGANVP
jgi:hypothetical protein